MKNACRITTAEWEIMNVAWARTPVAASDVTETLKPHKRWTLATVRTLLTRLVNKGALRQEQEGKRYLYFPRVTMEECARHETESFVDRALGRAPSATVLHLVQKAELSPRDIAELRRILREKEKQKA